MVERRIEEEKMAVAERWEVGEEVEEEGAVREEVLVGEWVEEGAVAFRGAEPGGVANLFLLKRMGPSPACSHVSLTRSLLIKVYSRGLTL